MNNPFSYRKTFWRIMIDSINHIILIFVSPSFELTVECNGFHTYQCLLVRRRVSVYIIPTEWIYHFYIFVYVVIIDTGSVKLIFIKKTQVMSL
ncbi:hypothetical protein GQ42DRAFT_24233 [Ramicandelaber brevisporus]|nr:hypothetical protein GQ42DRAFT_24233 [Ramicandelaber brevisporus]